MGFSIQPRQRVGEELRFAVIGPDGLGLPLRLLTQTEAEQLAGVLNQYLDDEAVADMLAAVASFQQDDYVMTDAEAQALRDPARRNVPKIPVRPLPIRPCCCPR